MAKNKVFLLFLTFFACFLFVAVSLLLNSKVKNKIGVAYAGEQEIFKEVFPDAASFRPVKSEGKIIYYKALDYSKKFMGAVFKASSVGYCSTIESLVGMYKDGTIIAIKILKQNETLGLGSRIVEREFTRQFSNNKDLSNMQAVTGATTSSRAVTESVKAKASEILALTKDEK